MINKFIIIGIVVIILILITILYFFFKKNYKHKTLIDTPQFLVDNYNKIISFDNLPPSNEGVKYTYTFFLFIKNIPENAHWNLDYDLPKGIISRYNSPNVYYLPSKHILQIVIGYKDNYNTISKYTFELDNLKIQTWEHISIVVSNRMVSIYLNSIIQKSIFLPNVPWLSNKFLYLGQSNNNFNGYISNLEYFNTDLNNDKIHNIYSQVNKLPKKLSSYSEYYYNKNKNSKQ